MIEAAVCRRCGRGNRRSTAPFAGGEKQSQAATQSVNSCGSLELHREKHLEKQGSRHPGGYCLCRHRAGRARPTASAQRPLPVLAGGPAALRTGPGAPPARRSGRPDHPAPGQARPGLTPQAGFPRPLGGRCSLSLRAEAALSSNAGVGASASLVGRGPSAFPRLVKLKPRWGSK